MMSGILVITQAMASQNTVGVEYTENALQELSDQCEQLISAIANLNQLEDEYDAHFEQPQLFEQKAKKLKLFESVTTPLLPDLGLRKNIQKEKERLQELHYSFLYELWGFPEGLKKHTQYIAVKNRYNEEIAYHFRAEESHVVTANKLR